MDQTLEKIQKLRRVGFYSQQNAEFFFNLLLRITNYVNIDRK